MIPEVGKGLYHAYPVKNIVPDAKQRYENMLRHLRFRKQNTHDPQRRRPSVRRSFYNKSTTIKQRKFLA